MSYRFYSFLKGYNDVRRKAREDKMAQEKLYFARDMAERKMHLREMEFYQGQDQGGARPMSEYQEEMVGFKGRAEGRAIKAEQELTPVAAGKARGQEEMNVLRILGGGWDPDKPIKKGGRLVGWEERAVNTVEAHRHSMKDAPPARQLATIKSLRARNLKDIKETIMDLTTSPDKDLGLSKELLEYRRANLLNVLASHRKEEDALAAWSEDATRKIPAGKHVTARVKEKAEEREIEQRAANRAPDLLRRIAEIGRNTGGWSFAQCANLALREMMEGKGPVKHVPKEVQAKIIEIIQAEMGKHRGK